MQFSILSALVLATAASLVAAAPAPQFKPAGCTQTPEGKKCRFVKDNKKVLAGNIWFPGAPGSRQVLKDAFSTVTGLRKRTDEAAVDEEADEEQ